MPLQFWDFVNPIDAAALAQSFRSAAPTHYFVLDNFLEPAFARAVARAYPSYQEAQASGDREFRRINEDVKVQITDSRSFPDAIARLHELMACPEWLDLLTQISGIESLEADPEHRGSGMFVMGPSGYLGVHVDFNMRTTPPCHRRLNTLLYLTEDWQESWQGGFEIWDPDVKELQAYLPPSFNRLVAFNTTRSSFHAVREICCPGDVTRNAFGNFYYTEKAPEAWDGLRHPTLYRARPNERFKALVQMPLDRWSRRIERFTGRVRSKLLGR